MYDSSDDTLAHIAMVRRAIDRVQGDLSKRSIYHDMSKLKDPEEKQGFDEHTPMLKLFTYGSDGYKQSLAKLKGVLARHYANNDHHPEHFPEGVGGMNLMQLTEMVCDWHAAMQRSPDGSVERTMEINIERFNLDPQVAAIVRRTLEWLEDDNGAG